MVVRAWRGYGAVTESEVYPKHLLHSVRPKLEQLRGFRGLYLLRRRHLEEIEFLVLTLWESMDAVRAFAGEQPDLRSWNPRPGPRSCGLTTPSTITKSWPRRT